MKKMILGVLFILICMQLFSDLSEGLVAYFPFNGNANDTSGNGNHGIVFGDITFVPDIINGRAAAFNQANANIVCPNIFLTQPGSFSISWWLYPESHTDSNQQMRSVNGWGSFVFHTTSSGSFYVGTDVSGRLTPGAFSQNMTLNQWQHYVFTYQSGTGSLYKNGQLIGAKPGMQNSSNWGGFQMGNGSVHTIDGLIDEVCVYNRAILQAEINQLYHADSPLPAVLSSFAAIQTTNNFAQINWTTQSETNLLGYNLYRNTENTNSGSQKINPQMIYGENSSIGSNYSYTDETVEYEQPYYYWLESVELSGNTELFGPVSMTLENPENNAPELPNMTILKQNYPNPFNPSTIIEFSIKENETGKLSIFNVKGQLIENKEFQTGVHSYHWNAEKFSSGMYFYRLQTQSVSQIKKMMMMK
jgi:hypothetical protein